MWCRGSQAAAFLEVEVARSQWVTDAGCPTHRFSSWDVCLVLVEVQQSYHSNWGAATPTPSERLPQTCFGPEFDLNQWFGPDSDLNFPFSSPTQVERRPKSGPNQVCWGRRGRSGWHGSVAPPKISKLPFPVESRVNHDSTIVKLYYKGLQLQLSGVFKRVITVRVSLFLATRQRNFQELGYKLKM